MECYYCHKEFTPAPWPATRAKYCSNRTAGSCGVRAYLERDREHLNEVSRWRTRNCPASVRAAKRKWNNTERGKAIRREWKIKHWPELYAKLKAAGEVPRIYARQKSRKLLIRSGRPMICMFSGQHQGRLECHHRDENPFNMRLRNLVWVCVGHHRIRHRKPLHQA